MADSLIWKFSPGVCKESPNPEDILDCRIYALDKRLYPAFILWQNRRMLEEVRWMEKIFDSALNDPKADIGMRVVPILSAWASVPPYHILSEVESMREIMNKYNSQIDCVVRRVCCHMMIWWQLAVHYIRPSSTYWASSPYHILSELEPMRKGKPVQEEICVRSTTTCTV